MIEIALYSVGICGVIGLGCFISWVMETLDCNSWRHKVTASDIEELKRLFDEEDAFVDFNDKGEKFLCGYIKD
jgi:hypothetical protein